MNPADDVTRNETANDRMKRRSAVWLPESIVLAVILHVALFVFAPDFSVAEALDADPGTITVMPPVVDIPEPPPPIVHPATPVVGSLDISTEVTIADNVGPAFETKLPPLPPGAGTGDAETYEKWVPSMVAPRLLNQAEVESALRRAYPPMLREAGIGGTVDVNLWLDETGEIVKAEVARPSGHNALDQAALEVVDAMRLAPAQNRGHAVRVIVTLPVVFRVQ